MKTTKLFLIPAILVALTFASCSDYDNGFTVNQIKYDKAFIDAFGNIDPNQDWNLVKQLEEKNGRSTRVAETGWENLGYTKPNSITQEEIDKVLAVFNQKGKESYEPLVNWSDFFVQHVWKGTASYTAGNNGTVVGGDHMDGLCAYNPVTNHDDHVNNFNNAFGSIMLMINSSTQRFGYNSTEDGQVHYYFRMEYIDGAYYVGLDFSAEGQNPNQQVQRDYIYNDWIIKIVPANGETPDPPKDQPDPEPTEEIIEAGLLCCEDLGGEDADFDFNDIVLKLEQKRRTSVKNGKEEVTDYFVITAMAAGGTLPSYVFYKSLKNADETQDRFYYSDWTPFGEVNGKNGIHGMMGGDLEPINVGEEFEGEGESHEYEVTDAINILRAYTNENAEVQEKIRLYADHYVSYVFDRARIRIYVNAQSPTDTIGRSYIEPIYHGIEDDEETSSFRAANTPQMMLLPLRFEWPTEATFIGTAYPNFGNWVREKENTDWYLNKEDDSYVTSRKVVEEELQPFLRWKDNDDIYLSITIKEGETIDLFCTSLNHNNPSVSDNASSDIASAGNIYYITNELNNHEFGIKLTGLKAGNTTITLTQDANEKYRAESITLNVTVESNPKEKSTNDLHWTSSTSLNMTAGGNAQSVSYKTSSTGALSVKSSNENVAVAKMGNNNTITVTPKSAGTATITLSQTEDANYKSGSIYFSVTVGENKPAGGYVDISNYIPQKNVQETNVPQEMFSELKTKITIRVQTEAFSDYCDLRLYCKHPTNGWTDFVNYERIPSDTTKTWTFTDSKIIDTIKNYGGLYIGGNNPYHVKKIEILCE